MRKLLDTKAGATFSQEYPQITIAVKKDGTELIYKYRPGTFIIVNLVRTALDEVMLFTNWGSYFKRLQNPKAQLPQIAKKCPKLYAILSGEDQDSIHEMDLGNDRENMNHGFGLPVKVSPTAPIFASVNEELLRTFTRFVQKNLDIYFELQDNPPFPAWKDGLSELWN